MSGRLRMGISGPRHQHKHSSKGMIEGMWINIKYTNVRYFAVHEPGMLATASFTNQLLENLIGVAKQRDVEYQQEINTVQDNTSLVIKTPWLWYNRWDKKFAGQAMNELPKLIEL